MRIVNIVTSSPNYTPKFQIIGDFVLNKFGWNVDDELLSELIVVVSDYLIGIDLNDYPHDYQEITRDWLLYKKQKKSAYKNKKSVDLFVNKLIRLSNNNPAQARLIVEDAMSNNYQGCFFKKPSNGDNKLTKLMEVYQNELDNI